MKSAVAVVILLIACLVSPTAQARGEVRIGDDLPVKIAGWLGNIDSDQRRTLAVTDFVDADYTTTIEGRRFAADLALAIYETGGVDLVPAIAVRAYLSREGLAPSDLYTKAHSAPAAEALGFDSVIQGMIDVRGDRTVVDVILIDAITGRVSDQKRWTIASPEPLQAPEPLDENAREAKTPQRIVVIPGVGGAGSIADCNAMLKDVGIDFTRREYRREFSSALRDQLRQKREHSEGRQSGGDFDGKAIVKGVPVGLSGAMDSARFSSVLQELESDEQRELSLNEMEILLEKHANGDAIRAWRDCVNSVGGRGISGDITIYEESSTDGGRISFSVLYLPLDGRDRGSLGLLNVEGGTVTSQTHDEGDVMLRGSTILVNVRPDETSAEVLVTLEIGDSVAQKAVRNALWEAIQSEIRDEQARARRAELAAHEAEVRKQERRERLRELALSFPKNVTQRMVRDVTGFDDGRPGYGELTYDRSYKGEQRARGIGMHPGIRDASITIDVPEGATSFSARVGFLGNKCGDSFGDSTCIVVLLGRDGSSIDRHEFALDGGPRDRHYNTGTDTQRVNLDVRAASRIKLVVRAESNPPDYPYCNKVFWFAPRFESDLASLLRDEGLN